MPNDNAMARAAGERQVAFRASMLPIGNYEDGSIAFPVWPQGAVDVYEFLGRFGRGEEPQPQDGLTLGGLAMTGGLASGLAAKTAVKPLFSLESRSAGLYNPPSKSPRPFEADYPHGAPANEAGKLTHDIEGRPLVAGHVVGRRESSGPDVALPREALDEITASFTGAGIREAAPRSPELGNDVGRAVFRRGGQPDSVHISRALSENQKPRVAAHEVGHVIDQVAGEIPVTGLSSELRPLYNTLQSGTERARNLVEPKHWGYKGDDVPREYMAEAIRAYMVDPNYIKTVAPKTAAKIREFVNGNEKLRDVVQFNANPSSAAPAGALSASGASEHHSRSQPRGQAGRWAAPESFDAYMHGLNQMLVDLDGDGQPDAVVPANTQMARASEGYATPPSDNLREMMPDYELPQSPYFLEDMMLDTENDLRSRDGLPPRNGPPFNVPPPRRGNIISGR